jgi:excinuclease ABC subunit C
LHLIQQIRDEAHRFAVTGHRQRRGKARTSSPLESIPGLGPKRRRLLLSHLGGLQEVARAGVEELAKVHGISRALAQRIYDALHGEGR